MEQSYITKIESLTKPSFQNIKSIAKDCCAVCCPGKDICKPWKDLEHGIKLLSTHEEMCRYLCSYGDMHEEKMLVALEQNKGSIETLKQNITIIDWGCGQGLATVCFFDYLNEKKISINTTKVILIEPSEQAIDRARLHIRTYLKDDSKIILKKKYLNEILNSDLKIDTPIVLHFFSNILDIQSVDLKILAQNIAANSKVDQYLYCITPTCYGQERIEAFYNYFKKPITISTIITNNLPKTDRTLKFKLFKLEAGISSLIKIKYYPPVQFHSAYQLDCVKQSIKSLSTINKAKYDLLTSFDVATRFDIGAYIYKDINPIYAVLNNIITRGLPTRTSPFIESLFEVNGNRKVNDDLSNIKYVNDQFINKDILDSIECLTPIAVARLQKTILEALITDRVSISLDMWKVLIIERDVPCAAIAFEDLRQMFYHLTSLSKSYEQMKFPEIELEIISSAKYLDSELHLGIPCSIEANNRHKATEYDMVIDISVLLAIDNDFIQLDEFKCKNNCYFNIRSANVKRSNRYIYTSDNIDYKSIVNKTNQGGYSEISEMKNHLQYFLQLLFRKEDFRPGQLPILDRALQYKSVIGLLPTGGGKSLTYQLAAMLQPGVTIVIDPLRSLMKDQYDGLINTGIDACAYINAELGIDEKKLLENQMESSQLQFVFMSPERLCIDSFRHKLKKMHEMNVYFAYGVIDEVHCVSEWGHDFKISYLHLGRNLYNYVLPKGKQKHIALFGLTATASFDVLADVERELSGNGAFPLDAESIIRYENTNRLELQYKIEKIEFGKGAIGLIDKWEIYKEKNKKISNYILNIPKLLEDLQSNDSIDFIKKKFIERENLDNNNSNDAEISRIKNANLEVNLADDWFLDHKEYNSGGIVFCPHRTGLLGVSNSVNHRGVAEAIKTDLPCENVGSFKGGDKTTDQDRFINNEIPLIVATKAFGMGIDKPNVRFTVNINMSSSLEAFVQEAGRAGRDRRLALATILYCDYKDVDKDVQLYFFDKTFKGAKHEKEVMNLLLSETSIEFCKQSKGCFDIVCGFMNPLLKAEYDIPLVFNIPYNDDNLEYIAKAIYRMCCIELIDDFTQDYENKKFKILAKRKKSEEYYSGLKRFLMRYYSEDKAEMEIKKVPLYKGDNEIHKCLGYLTEFIYEKIAVKRKRAIDDMRAFCVLGLDDSKDWKEVNEDLKDYIYYYFNSKYAKDDYTTDNGQFYSLTKDTDKGKLYDIEIVEKYMRVVDDSIVGTGTPKDSIKHLQGAVRLIRRSLTDINPSLDLLNAFCLFYLGTNNNKSLEQELYVSYRDGLIGFFNKIENSKIYWNFFEIYNNTIIEKAKDYPKEKLEDLKNEIILTIHASLIRKITDKYITT